MILKRRQLFQMFKNIKNISEYSSTFRPPSRGDCSIFYVSFSSPQTTTIVQMFKSMSKSSSTFHPPSRGDCSIFLRVIFKRYAFSCGKKEWPAGRHEGKLRFNTCNFAT